MASIVGGLAKLTRQLEEVGLAFTVDDLMPGAQIIFDISQDLCPVDTGYLKSTGFVRAAGDDVEIGYEADYASYVEFGTYKMSAQPFLRPAFDEGELRALSAIVDSVEAHMRQVIE